ncbi:MAG: ATP-grasp domain-containing protein [Patescibacteria group bacterium]|jgi:hypothetical protein
MAKLNSVFDITVVYDAKLAHSAADVNYLETAPFAKNSAYFNCNATYQYFIEHCKKLGLRAAFTTTNDVTATGQFSSVWTHTLKWERCKQTVSAKVIFDKFSNLQPRNQAAYYHITTAGTPPPLFHNQAMRLLFDNKLATFLMFPHYSIPTVKVTARTKTALLNASKILQTLCETHPYHEDFNTTMILKDQFGIGGNNIFKITNNDFSAVPINTTAEFILQPFIQASGFKIAHHAGNTDLRVIIFNNTVVQSYLRIAKAGEFRANAQQGGRVVYLALNDIPADVLKMIAQIKKRLPNKTTLYTLDFIKSNHGHLYFIEGNNSPGLNWFDAEDEIRAKELIHLIVRNLQQLIFKPH